MEGRETAAAAAAGLGGPDVGGRRRELVAALRGGGWLQTRGALQRHGRFCCLGVACEVAMSVAGRKVTFNLTTRAASALLSCQQATGGTLTETINDALRLYAMVLSKPDASLMLQEPGGQMERILVP